MNQLLSIISRMAAACFIILVSLSSQAQSNYAVNNDGTNDYVSLPASVSVSQLNTFTIEAWVYWTGANNGCIYSETISGNNNPMFSIIPRSGDGGGIELTFRDNSTTGLILQPATATVTPNIWVHVAVVRTSATNIKTYINGVLKDNSTFTAPASWTPTKVNVGVRWRASQTDFFSGKIDELRIWNTARTQTEIKTNMFNKDLANNATGLVAYYRFNAGSGTVAANSCTNTSGVNGTFTNGPTWTASPVQFTGNALHFDQADDRILAPLATTASSNVTMEFWLYHEGGVGTDHLLMVNGVMGTNGYALYINTQRKLCVQYNGVGTWNTNVVLSSNVWTHLALVVTTTGFIVYRDGVNVYSNTAVAIAPTTDFIIGFNTVANGQPFDGMMDEVRVWNTARTQTEIQNKMNGEIDPAASGLVLYYSFNQGSASGTNTGLTTLIDQSGNGKNGTLTNFALSGSTSNYLTQNSGLVLLPLKWLSFTATNQDNNILLQWATASEMNTLDFQIERSTDGKEWTRLGTVMSDNTTGTHNYTFTDAAPTHGANYYRIRQNDIDGRFSYSDVRSVWMNDRAKSIEVMMNPVMNKTLKFVIRGASGQVVSLFDNEGRLIWRKQFSMGTHVINLAPSSKGIYLLQSGSYSEKLLVQ